MVPDVVVPHFRGSSTHVFEVSRHLAKMGHDVTVVARRLDRSQPRWEKLGGFHVYRTFQGIIFEPPLTTYSDTHADQREGASSFVRSVYGLYLKSFRAVELGLEAATLFSGRGLDIVIERETAFGAGAVLSRIMGVPLVLEVIGPRSSPLSLRTSSLVLTYTPGMLKGAVPASRVKVVSGAVNTRLFKPDQVAGSMMLNRQRLTGGKVVGYVGTFPDWHGVGVLVAAMKDVIQRCPGTKLLLVGPYFEASKEVVEGMGLQDSVRFTGAVPYEDVPAYINACDVLCAPYDPSANPLRAKQGIGAPLKVMEYMACEKPVVTTDVPPIPDVVTDGTTGFLVPPGDPLALGDSIVRLLRDAGLAARVGRASRELVESRYSWGAFSADLEADLKNVLAAHSRTGANPSGEPA